MLPSHKHPVALAIVSLDNTTLTPKTLDAIIFLLTNLTCLHKVLMSSRYIVCGSLKKCLAPQKSRVSLSFRLTFSSSWMSKKCFIWMDGSLSIWMVVISMVGIILVVEELEVAIAESLRGVWILERKLKCFRVVSNAKSFDVLRFCSGTFDFFKHNY